MNVSDHLPTHVIINANLPTAARCSTQDPGVLQSFSNYEIRWLYTNPLECKRKRLLVEYKKYQTSSIDILLHQLKHVQWQSLTLSHRYLPKAKANNHIQPIGLMSSPLLVKTSKDQ